MDAASSRENSKQSLLASDSIFSLSELERVLRFADNDANALPQRLAALLGQEVSDVRQVITTDSWNTPALTGDVATTILTYFSGLSPAITQDILSPDLHAGLRFDVNRPATTLAQKRLYCRDLFVLMVALGALPDADLAQWVVNVMDYRDADSNMTDFEWDDDLSNGWDPSQNNTGYTPNPADPTRRNPVFGVERPDLVIAQTVATNKNGSPPEGELFVVLYRPPGETIDLPNGSIDYAPVDPALAGTGANSDKIDLSKTVGGSYVWRLHYYELSNQNDPTSIKSSTSKYILPTQVPHLPANGGTPFDQDNTTATLNPIGGGQFVSAGEYILIGPQLPGEVNFSLTSNATANVKHIQLEYGADLRIKNGDTSGSATGPDSSRYVVALERLRDPAVPYNAANNPYVPVDALRAKPNNPSSTLKSFYRKDNFWQAPGQELISKAGPTTQLPSDELLNQSNRDALNWANRPFVSQAEIALVPPGNGVELFQQIRPPAATDEYFYLASSSDSSQPKKAFNPDPSVGRSKFEIARDLLAATRVMSRASGANRRIDVSQFTQQEKEALGLYRSGLDVFPNGASQIACWREPGQVNLNLMPTEDVAVSSSINYETHRSWRCVLGNQVTDAIFPVSGTTSPFSGPDSAKPVTDLLGLGTPGQLFRDTTTQAGRHPFLSYKTAIKLGNVGTIRSNVFAVWITLRVRNTQTDEKTYHRLFAIVDRSIPVAFAPGQDLNAANTIRLKRYIN